MHPLNSLLELIERLLGPGGCPWDQKQTLASMRPNLIEEAYEVIEAIDLEDNSHMEEELGDLLFNVIFLCRLAKKEGRFTLEDVLTRLIAKLIYRHPHVFGKAECKNGEEVLKQWEQIKQIEDKGKNRHSLLDGIPKNLPSLARAQKMLKKLKKSPEQSFLSKIEPTNLSPEKLAGERLWELTQELADQGIQVEQALQKKLSQLEAAYRASETAS